ncbi:beta-ketoacyl synthase N-terminal-like domain-containing protein, partial [Acinetobacter oleivorans]|uniref:beta-ketoacyl synthase N-terminal-like domain-containing protein n=1 Tax=Acinetobacter oleivorans TaxID=1148157 RepID=UPI001580D70B
YKLPGNASNEENLWKVLNSNNHVYSDVCKSGRWSNEFHDSSKMPSPGKAYVANAGLLENIKQFDSNFFDIPAIEANYLDPQQRILLETSWHALEHANINPNKLRGSNTGVFVGVTTDDYARLHSQSGLLINSYTGIGSAKSIAAGRLAYFYDFKGPVIQLDTTCSSSLVCIHLALQELRKKSCDLALVAGVNAILSPETTIGFCEMKALSKSGKLSAFDDTADGYIRGEGGGVFVLKRLKDAEKDGNNIHAIILGSAINHDGKTNGLTAPNPNSQIAVIKEAIKNAKLEIDDIDYVETHGTGTKLGDLMEANALGAIFSKKNKILEIGSVKANIGHLEAAAGIASLAKTMLLIKKREIPGQVNLNQKSTKINWENLNLNIDSKGRKLSQNKQLKIGISGFGMSGTNAHII